MRTRFNGSLAPWRDNVRVALARKNRFSTRNGFQVRFDAYFVFYTRVKPNRYYLDSEIFKFYLPWNILLYRWRRWEDGISETGNSPFWFDVRILLRECFRTRNSVNLSTNPYWFCENISFEFPLVLESV